MPVRCLFQQTQQLSEQTRGLRGRLLHRLNETPDASERETLHGVRRDVQTFAGSAEQFDDITMLGFTYLGQDTQDKSGA